MPRIKTSITLPKEVMDWVQAQIDERVYSSLSHAVEYALYQQMKKGGREKPRL